MPRKVWDEITYPFPNVNGSTVEFYEWISNFPALYNVCDYLSITMKRSLGMIFMWTLRHALVVYMCLRDGMLAQFYVSNNVNVQTTKDIIVEGLSDR